MSDSSRWRRIFLRTAPLLGIALLVYLVATANLDVVAARAQAIGWGLPLVIALGGLSHAVKTWAWRLTLRDDARRVSYARSLGLRLISEAIGQFGFIGMVGGEATRISLLASDVSIADALSSVTLDRSLFIITGAVVTIMGIAALVFAVSLPHGLYVYAGILVIALLGLVSTGALAIQKRWPVFSGPARGAARIPWLRKWLRGKESTFRAAEQRISQFCHEAPGLFVFTVLLNFACHFLAVVEVFLLIKMLGAPASLAGSLILESLTKLINVAGAVNPGNVGTYEAGNMAIGQVVHLTGTQGLVLALCRRARAVFWAIIGFICLAWFSKGARPAALKPKSDTKSSRATTPADSSSQLISGSETVLILAHDLPPGRQFEPALAKVATVPVLLRTILSVQAKGRPLRTIVAVNPVTGLKIQNSLLATGRLPASVEWMEISAETTLSPVLRRAGTKTGRLAIVRGNCTYHPALVRRLHDWDGENGAIEFVSSGEPIGIVALTQEMAAECAAEPELIANEMDLHHWIAEKLTSPFAVQSPTSDVDQGSWQRIDRPDDCIAAEIKLERWLVKPTDGVFARMNRRISIPISRQMLRFPITPNMISLAILGISLVGSACFAVGGYWYMLLGALLGVLTSILDGCDGEVARLKLQVSDLGCWLDTLCDYLYYVTTFAGITIGLVRGTGETRFVGLSGAVFCGAILTFVAASLGRKRLSGQQPEQYLAIWQKRAENRSAGLLLNFGRHTEFIVRRCFLPYLILVLAMLNLMPAFMYMAAFGANVAWIVSLRSLIAFSSRRRNGHEESDSPRPATARLTRRLSDSTS